MKRLERAAVVLALLDAMKLEGSWCGGTHLQKAVYFLQEVCEVPLGYRFILYKHGPYSFEFNEALTRMRAVSMLTLELRGDEYGPSYAKGELSDVVVHKFKDVIANFKKDINFVAEKLGGNGVAALERLATALLVRIELGGTASVAERAERIEELKPHIPFKIARRAVETVDEMIRERESRQRKQQRGTSTTRKTKKSAHAKVKK